MIAKRIPHKTQCDHAQTPYARRKCRATKLAAAAEQERKAMEKPRFDARCDRPGVWTVVDTHTGKVVMRDRDEAMIRQFAAARNEQASAGTLPTAAPAAEPATETSAPTPAPRTGWSKAAQRRAGRPGRSHPLGDVVDAGDGYTVYRDGLTDRGTVQIWDES